MKLPKRFLDSGLAELIEYGASVRTINILENQLNAIWIKDLQGKTRTDLLSLNLLAEKELNTLIDALELMKEERS